MNDGLAIKQVIGLVVFGVLSGALIGLSARLGLISLNLSLVMFGALLGGVSVYIVMFQFGGAKAKASK